MAVITSWRKTACKHGSSMKMTRRAINVTVMVAGVIARHGNARVASRKRHMASGVLALYAQQQHVASEMATRIAEKQQHGVAYGENKRSSVA